MLKLLTIRLGERALALDLMGVRELRAYQAPTPLPRAPRHVRGMLNLRGAILPVVDLADLLGWPTAEPGPRHVIVVVAIAGPGGATQLHGLIVDAVTDIIEVAEEALQPVPDEHGQAGLLAGLLPRGEELVLVLALQRLGLGSPLAEAA
jgi:purine-binding chemotaxis protein CheW